MALEHIIKWEVIILVKLNCTQRLSEVINTCSISSTMFVSCCLPEGRRASPIAGVLQRQESQHLIISLGRFTKKAATDHVNLKIDMN
jgi:hypothetical protein